MQLFAKLYRKVAEDRYALYIAFPKHGICDFFKSIYKKFFYEKISKYSNLPHYDQCPLPRNNYFVKDYPLDARDFQRFLSPGDYRLEANIMEDDKELAGIIFYGSIKEKTME